MFRQSVQKEIESADRQVQSEIRDSTPRTQNQDKMRNLK